MENKIKFNERKSTLIRESGRSSDYISPSFGHGCLLNCSYCYLKRHKANGLDVATNPETILTAINNHSMFAVIDKPNQTDPKYITYDIACNEDFALHAKYHDWKRIFQFFKEHPIAKATLATKIIPDVFLEFNPERKVRIRFSLMPQEYSNLLEPNTSLITDRINAIDKFIDAGYDVHINYSPVIIEKGWLEKYKLLFEEVDRNVKNKDIVKAEVIFLTHNRDKHLYNLRNNLPGENLIWKPEIQEDKVSEFGGENLRYTLDIKKEAVKNFIKLHSMIIPWNTIRYIF